MLGRATTDDMLTLQAILLTSSLLLMLGMVASLMFLAMARVRDAESGLQVENVDGHAHLDSPA